MFLTSSGLTLATLITDMTSLFTAVLGWLSSIIEFVAGEPLLMVFVLIVLVKIVVKICRKWIPGL